MLAEIHNDIHTHVWGRKKRKINAKYIFYDVNQSQWFIYYNISGYIELVNQCDGFELKIKEVPKIWDAKIFQRMYTEEKNRFEPSIDRFI